MKQLFRTPRALLTLFACLWLVACSDRDVGDGPRPVVLVGIDGAEWRVIDAMIAEGELPHFARLKGSGAWGPLMNPGPQISPVVWTTFATGRFSRTHGILAHVYPYADEGDKRPLSSDLRQVPALWNIAGGEGKRATVVGYFVTHPPEHIDEGTIVSPLAPQGNPAAVWPPGALDFDDPLLREMEDPEVRSALLSRYFAWDFDRAQTRNPESPYREAAEIVVERNLDRRVYADEFLHRAALQLSDRPSDLFVSYYRLVDYMSHSLWMFYDASDFETPPDPAEQALFGEAVRESYRFADRALGDLLERWEGRANILVVSDHGFGSNRKWIRGASARFKHLTGDHRPVGILLATGPDIMPGEIQGLTIMEIAPTVAALMGLAVADDWPGAVANELLRPAFLERHPVRTVNSHDAVQIRRGDAELTTDEQADDLDNLRGLGYIGEGVGLDADADIGDYDFWASGRRVLTDNLQAEIVYYLIEGDVESAQAVLNLLRERRPRLERRLLNLVQTKYRGLNAQLPPGVLDPEPFRVFLAANGREKALAPAPEKVDEQG